MSFVDDDRFAIPDLPDGAGDFGRWTVDEAGLPAYDYTCDPATAPWAASFRTDGPPSADHWHQVGNDRLVATAHAEGPLVPFLSDRGKLWLCARDGRRRAWGGGFGWLREGETVLGTNLWSFRPRDAQLQRRFGIGYYEKTLRTAGLTVRHRVTAPFGDDPVLRIEIELTNHGDRPRELEGVEHWGVRLEPVRLHLLATGWIAPPGGRTASERVAWRVANLFSAASRRIMAIHRRIDAACYRYRLCQPEDAATAAFVPRWIGPRPSPTSRAAIDYYPRPLFLAPLAGDGTATGHSRQAWFGRGGRGAPDGLGLPDAGRIEPGQPCGDPCLIGRVRAVVPPGARRRARFLFGMAETSEVAGLRARHREDTTPAQWCAAVPRPKVPEMPWLTREIAWHGGMLRSHLTWEEYFGNHVCDQGCTYGYLQGMNSVPRDMALVAAPLTYLAPERAKEVLRYILRMVKPDGTIYYATHGRGQAGFAGIHTHPSDLWPMVFWALAEYVGATGDRGLLHEELPFYPLEAGSSTVLARLRLGLRFLQDRIGLGEHGLLRVGSGDWSDGIQLMVRSRHRFLAAGESVYTAALAEIACRRLASLVADEDAGFAGELRALATGQGEAWRSQWTGAWYRRAWDGQGNPVGDERVFLEHLVWCLVAGVPAERQGPLLQTIATRLQRDSPIGARLVDPPTRTRFGMLTPGWDVNGGVWAAMNGILTWGLGLVDPARGWAELEANSLYRHATAYPRCWYGIWSGPDAYNAVGSDRPGETFVHLASPMTDFPVMNMNRHSSTLLATLRLLGLDADGDGLQIHPRLADPSRPVGVRLPLVSYWREGGRLTGEYRFVVDGTQRLTVASPPGEGALVATVDDRPVETAGGEGSVVLTLTGRAGETRRFGVARRA